MSIPKGHELMNLVTSFSTPHDAVAAVRDEARSSRLDLYLLPYQPMNPDAPWWISPGNENPGYRYGKAIFARDLLRPQELFIGLYMEKGIGGAAAAIYADSRKGRRYIMAGQWRIGEGWTWPSFLSAMASGDLDAVAGAEATAGQPLVVTVDGSHVPVPAGPGDVIDVHSLNFPRDVIAFRYSAGALTPLRASHPADLLRPLGSAATLQALATAIQGLPDLDTFWIDVALGLCFQAPAANATTPHDAWDARALWDRTLSPWRAWFH